MHDINGKLLQVGDDITTYAHGMMRICGTWGANMATVELPSAKMRDEPFIIDLQEMKAVKVRSWKELAQEALQVGGAVNLSGVVSSFHHIIREVRARLESEGKFSTSEVNTHPICVLFADKMVSLAGASNDEAINAYVWAKTVSSR